MKRLALLWLLFCGVAAAQVVTPPGGASDFSGPTKVAVVLANFSDAAGNNRQFDQGDIDTLTQQMFGPGPNISDLFDEMSFGVDSFYGDVLPPVTINSTGYTGSTSCSFGTMNTWRQEAIAKVHETNPGILNQGNSAGYQLVAVFMSMRNDCDNSNSINGGAYRLTGGVLGPNDLAAVVMNNWRTAQTAAHEFGHLKGWGHSQLEGYTGVGKGYGDHSCVMGDNYIYSNHPEYPEYSSTPGGPPVLLDMRQAHAPNKIHAGYIAQMDLFDTPDAAGTSSVYLAPTQVAPGDFPDPPAGATLSHAAVVDITGVDDIYIISYRSAFDDGHNAYDSDPLFDHLMGRVHVHSFPRIIGSEPFRIKHLEAGESFTDGSFELTAVTDGLNDELYVEVEIEVFPFFAPEVEVASTFDENNLTTISGAFPLTVTNPGPAGSIVSDFDLSIANADPAIIGATFTPPTLTLGPDQGAPADIVLEFATPPADGTYAFDIVVTDAANPRPVETVRVAYVNDLIGPQIGGLDADHQGNKVILSWTEERATDTYDIKKNGSTLITGYTSPSVNDFAVSAGQEPVYEVQGTDIFGNVGPWKQATGIYPCKTPPSLSIDTMELKSSTSSAMASTTATITNHNPSSCPDFNYSLSSPTVVPEGWNVAGSNVTVAGDSSGTTSVSVVFFPFPNPTPDEERFAFSLKASDLNGFQSAPLTGIFFTHDLTNPQPPTNPVACVANGGIDLLWGAGSDNVGIAAYNVFGASGLLGSTPSASYLDSTFDAGYEIQTVDYVDRVSNLATAVPTLPSATIASIVTNQANPPFAVEVTNHNDVVCSSATFDLGVTSGNITVDSTVSMASGASATANGTLNESQEGVYTFQMDVQGTSVSGSATIDLTAPTAPTALAIVDSGGAASLSWNAASDALTSVASYDIYRDGASLGSATGTSFLDSTPPSASAIAYEVRAVDEAGNQSAGDLWSLSIGNIAKDFSVCNQATVSWTTTESVACTMRYRLFGASSWSSPYATATGTQHAVTVPTARNKKYNVEVDCIAETAFIMKTPKYCISM